MSTYILVASLPGLPHFYLPFAFTGYEATVRAIVMETATETHFHAKNTSNFTHGLRQKLLYMRKITAMQVTIAHLLCLCFVPPSHVGRRRGVLGDLNRLIPFYKGNLFHQIRTTRTGKCTVKTPHISQMAFPKGYMLLA